MLRLATACAIVLVSFACASASVSVAAEPAKVTEDDVVQWLYGRFLTTPEKVPPEERLLEVDELAIKYVLDSDLELDVNKPSLEGKSLSIAQMGAKKVHVVFLDALSAERQLDLASKAEGERGTLMHLLVLAAPSSGWLKRIVSRQEGMFEIASEPRRDFEHFVGHNPFLNDDERKQVRDLLRSWEKSGKIREIRSP